MRNTAFMLLLCCCISAAASGQGINISAKNESLEKVFGQLEKQSGYTFFYKIELVRTLPKITVDIKHGTLIGALTQVLQNQSTLTWKIVGKTVVISKAEAPPLSTADQRANLLLVTGRVVDRDGQGIPNVSISLKGTQFAWKTNPEGIFTSALMEGAQGPGKPLVLAFSSIGFAPKEMKVDGPEKNLIITLREQVNTLDEVQMTAYSKTSKRYNVGDITTINSDEIARNPVPNVLQALQARVPGMLIQTQTGQPNGSFHVQIRSLNTLSGGAATSPQFINNGGQPLYIIDGVEYPADGSLPLAQGFNGPQYSLYGNALNFLDPSQFESISILKGPDATSLYGSRGAFGVILITTKKAKGGRPSFNLNVLHGFSNLSSRPKLMNNDQYLAMRREAFANNNNATPGAQDYDLNGTWDTTKNTDWEHYFLGGHAPTTRINANYSGGSANSSYLIGANYNSIGNIQFSKGAVKTGGMNFSLNTSTTDRKFTLGLTGSYSTNVDNMVPVDYTGSVGVLQAPDAPDLVLPNGKLNWDPSLEGNPLNMLYTLHNSTTNTLLANMTLNWTPVKGLSFIASGGYSLISAKEFEATPSAYFNPATFVTSNTRSLLSWYTIRTFSVDPRIQYENVFFGKGRLSAIVGATLRDKLQETTAIQGNGIATDELLRNPANAATAFRIDKYTTLPVRYTGPFATLNFRWADKYILELNGRRDGDSRFGPGNQFGNFGSIAGGWIISEEPWFRPVTGIIDFLKIKGSYGLTGANSLQPYQYISTYALNSNSYNGGIGLAPSNLANPYLHWETDKNAEAGINIGFLKEAINIEAIYYFNHMDDQLTNQSLASITGFPSFTYNTPARIYTHGLELNIVTHNIRRKNFSWETRINFTAPRSKLTAYPGVENLVSNFNYVVGKPITGIKLYKYAGVDPETGVYNFINAAGVKGQFTPIFSPVQLDANKDKTEFVDLAPKYYGGILNSFNYGNFSMDFLISLTNKMGPNFEAYQTFPMGVTIQNFPEDYAAKRWKKKGDITTVPKATSNILAFFDQGNFVSSTGAYSNATYARLQNLSLTYRFSHNLIQKWRLSGLSIYVAGQNLFTISKYGDLDPENMSAGRMPPLRVFTGGINVNF